MSNSYSVHKPHQSHPEEWSHSQQRQETSARATGVPEPNQHVSSNSTSSRGRRVLLGSQTQQCGGNTPHMGLYPHSSPSSRHLPSETGALARHIQLSMSATGFHYGGHQPPTEGLLSGCWVRRSSYTVPTDSTVAACSNDPNLPSSQRCTLLPQALPTPPSSCLFTI